MQVHGRLSYRRVSKLIFYIFYKFTDIIHTGSVLLLLNLDQFTGKLNISTQGRHEIRKYMTKFDGQRKSRCSVFSKASEHVGSMLRDRHEIIPWQESFSEREDAIVAPPFVLPELIGSPSKSKVGQNTALGNKIGRGIFASLSSKLINIRKCAALSLDAAAVSSTCSHAAVSKAQSFSKNQFNKSYPERSRKFNEKRLLQAHYSFSNLPENSGFSVLLRRSMELIGSFEEGSLAHRALVSNSPPVLQTKSVRIHDFCFYVMPKIIHFQVSCNLLNTSHIQTQPTCSNSFSANSCFICRRKNHTIISTAKIADASL
jgi:hypothetical protein